MDRRGPVVYMTRIFSGPEMASLSTRLHQPADWELKPDYRPGEVFEL